MRKNLKIWSLIFALVIFLSACSTGTNNGTVTGEENVSGTYEGVGNGKGGEIKLEVTLNNSEIEDIVVLEHKETPGYDSALDTLAKDMIAKNSTDVDSVSGATLTSNGFKEAVNSALESAGINPGNLTAKEMEAAEEKQDEELSHDIVVIGAGGAGLTAAIQAKEAGADVIVLEKMPFVGGNTLISGAEIAAPGNWIQESEGIEDSADLFYEDVLKGGGNPELIRVLADNSLDAAKWLQDDVGVVWEDKMMFFGGHTVERSLVPLGNTGKEIITKLQAKAEELDIPIYLNTKATELIQDGEAIAGVKAEGQDSNYTINSKAVIITTGGFGSNVEMRVKYNPEIDDSILSTNSTGSTGDGITMAEAVGANLVDMEQIQLYPICDPLTGTLLYADDTRLYGGTILVNKEGKRFVEELDTRYAISMGIKAQTDSVAYELWDDAVTQDSAILKNHPAEIEYLKNNDLLAVADTLDEVADAMGVDKEALQETVETFNGYVDGGEDLEFNKRGKLIKIEKPPFYLLKAAPAVHHTMGGIEIDTTTHVINTEGNRIEGLYAAGEVTGGIHGNNRLGSAAIADITVFGIIAGETAASEIQ